MAERSTEQQGWHLKKEVQLGHLITTITVAVACMAYVNGMDRRIALLEQAAVMQKETNARLERTVNDSIASVDRKLERINDKLDSMKGGK